MSATKNAPPTSAGTLQDYETLERDLQSGIGLAEARAERLMGEVFLHPHLATQAFGKLSRRRGFAHAIQILEHTVLRRELTFGVFRTGLLGWRRRAVAAAIAELPEALRDLKHLNERLGDVRSARLEVMQRSRNAEPSRDREVRVRSRDLERTR